VEQGNSEPQNIEYSIYFPRPDAANAPSGIGLIDGLGGRHSSASGCAFG
jgi:hypothetical protein